MSDRIAEKREKVKAAVKQKKAETKDRIEKTRQAVKSAVKAKLAPQNAVTSNRLKLLVTVVARNKGEYYADLIQSFEVNMQMLTLAEGTASAKTLSLLGLSDTQKTVIFSVIQENKISDCMAALSERFKTVKGGNGIAYTIPLTSLIGTLLFGFLSNNKKAVKGNN